MPTAVQVLDLNFQGIPHVIAAYLIKHSKGAVIIESGPGSTVEGLKAALKMHALTVEDVTDVLLTHIHLDHAGASGWLARHGAGGRGARIYVHPNGAPHLLNPEKLLKSATRIYGPLMDQLWGEFLAVPEDRLVVVRDNQDVSVNGLRFCAIDTPGHADHHFAYLFEETLFTGDVGGIRLPGPPHLRIPMPPPEFHLEKWRASWQRMMDLKPKRVAPTHFGIYEDVDWHLDALKRGLDEVEAFMQAVLPADLPVPEIGDKFMAWTENRSRREGLPDELTNAYEAANPSWMSATGMQRYWRKYRVDNSLTTDQK
jgi:glyoxylase-like metal-dependent hydrolase (beta-lactamase superfamily II)